LDLTTHMPDLMSNPLGLEFFLNGKRLAAISLFSYGWLELEINVSENLDEPAIGTNETFEFEIRADRTWQPCAYDRTSQDDRQLSIAVCNIEAYL
ncbi:MAG: hypothetical protein M3R52_08770, partial [Acidobacteriota bacterium]|nr:hypothetical protein [Acidobacteriota bacterium]